MIFSFLLLWLMFLPFTRAMVNPFTVSCQRVDKMMGRKKTGRKEKE